MITGLLIIVLLGHTSAQEGEVAPKKCPDNTITDEVCTRVIKQYSNNPSGQMIEMTYWVTLEDDIPYFNGHLFLKTIDKTDGSDGRSEARVCVEFGTDKDHLYTWREQIMFVASINTRGGSKGAMTWSAPKTLKKTAYTKNLTKAKAFCALNDSDEGFVTAQPLSM